MKQFYAKLLIKSTKNHDKNIGVNEGTLLLAHGSGENKMKVEFAALMRDYYDAVLSIVEVYLVVAAVVFVLVRQHGGKHNDQNDD